MKTKFILSAILFLPFLFSKAQVGQVTNNYFQTWTNPHTPDGWITLDSLFSALNENLGTSVKDNSDKVNGEACSLKLTTVAEALAPNGAAPGIVALGTGVVIANNPTFPGVPFTYRPDTLWFLCHYSTTTHDTASAEFALIKGGAPIFQANLIIDTATNYIWNYYIMTGNYISEANPDTLGILFSSSFDTARIGDVLHLQAVLFGYVNQPSGLKEIADKLNVSLYPNPASQMVTISAAGDVSGYKMYVSDANGRIVSIYTLEGNKSEMDVTSFASGAYFYRLADKAGNILKQDKFVVTR